MNAREASFEFTCLGKKINEIVSALFHSVIFNRCFGKFRYEFETSYSIGTLGFEEVFCNFIDFTYIQVASYELVKNVNRDIKNFVEQLLSLAVSNNNSTALTNLRYPNSLPVVDSYADMGSLSSAYTAATGTISLEFLIKSSRTWTFAEPLVWEVWTLKVNCLKDDANEDVFNKTSIEDQLFDKMLSVVQIMNNCKSSKYLPSMPSQSELDNVFDTSYPDAQPYNFKISYKLGANASETRLTRRGSVKNSTQEAIKFFRQKLAI